MARLPLLCLLLVLTASLALAALPCKTREEAMAEAVVGFFLVQRIAAERCDEHHGGEAFRALHRRLEQQYGPQVTQAGTVRAAYFQRAHGEQGAAELRSVDALLTELLSAQLVVNDESCAGLKAELGQRLSDGWEPIRARLARRVDAVPGHDANRCTE
jgi:hypothetical protein